MSVIDDYLASLSATEKATLQHMYGIVRSVVPDATEEMSYNMPSFKYKGKGLVAIIANKNFMSLYPFGSIERLGIDVSTFEQTKGSIHFTTDNPISDELLTAIITARKQQIENKAPSVDELAKILWDYLQLHEQPVNSDLIFCLCSHDTRVAKRAAQLFLQGRGEYLVFSGGVGKLTKGMFEKSEAEHFAEIARSMGVPSGKIIIENKSTNTGENIRFTYELLSSKHIKMDSMILVQKPYMERRAYATFKKQWPNSSTKITVTSPRFSYEEYLTTGAIPKEDIINVMVGDMQRICEYPKKGFQIKQDIPHYVWDAYEQLVSLGFTKHAI